MQEPQIYEAVIYVSGSKKRIKLFTCARNVGSAARNLKNAGYSLSSVVSLNPVGMIAREA